MNNPLDAGIFLPATSEDHALVVAANRGNANVFETLFERYNRRYSRSRCASRGFVKMPKTLSSKLFKRLSFTCTGSKAKRSFLPG